MDKIPGHTSPNYTSEAHENALFHYTTGDGLLGILKNKNIWSTAYYCTNDESELSAGKGILTKMFREKTAELQRNNHHLVSLFRSRGVDIIEYANKYEQSLISYALHTFCIYLTCFCRPNNKEDFIHGLLSQWRGYGVDGGYALQINRTKLQELVDKVNVDGTFSFDLKDIYYNTENALKNDIETHSSVFVNAYMSHLDWIANLDISLKAQEYRPLDNINGPALVSLLNYIVHTKNSHYSEENECRLSILEPISDEFQKLPVEYYNRNGMIVPYVTTPNSFDFIDCVDWIIVGPGSRMNARFNSVKQMVRSMGLNISVRPSHIPFVRS